MVVIMSDDLVEKIYESAFIPELWPDVLDTLSEMSASSGGALLASGERHPPRWAASQTVAPALRAFASSDAWKYNKRPQRWLAANHAGFIRDVDLFTADELRGDRMRAELQTHGLGWQLGTVIPMPSGEVVVFSLERRFDDGPHDQSLKEIIDPFRPHLARAGLLAARLGLERARTAVTTLEAIGLPAAVLSASGRVIASNGLLDGVQILLPASHGELAVAEPAVNELLKEAISAAAGFAVSRSIPIGMDETRSASVIHILPISGAVHDIFSGAAVIVVVTAVSASNMVPSPDVLMGLFDLTPSEARLAIALTAGRSVKDASEDSGVTVKTSQTYLERIFAKTGTHQQSQLVALLKSAGPFREVVRPASTDEEGQ